MHFLGKDTNKHNQLLILFCLIPVANRLSYNKSSSIATAIGAWYQSARGTMPPVNQETPATRRLSELDIPHALHVHEKPLRSLEQAADERGLQHGQIVRSLLFRLEDHSYVLVLVAGPGRVDWVQLRKYLGVRRLTTADDSEVLEVTGYPPGAVSPIGLKQPMRILADRSLEAHEIISVGAGIHDAGIILRTSDLMRSISVEFTNLIVGQR